MDKTTRLVLGTPQFGMAYGINENKKISYGEIQEIFNIINLNNLSLDTAAAYGDSEKIIGDHASIDTEIITKISVNSSGETREQFFDSMVRLKRKHIYTLLLHNFENIKSDIKIWDEFVRLKKQGFVEKVGFSIYYPEQVEWLFDKSIDFDLIQIPYSVFDQRFSSMFGELKKRNIEVHARSVFLQGLFFKNLNSKEQKKFCSLLPSLQKIKAIANQYEISISHMCMGFALLNKSIDKIVLGVDSSKELRENLNYHEGLEKTKNIYKKLLNFHQNDDKMIVPLNW